jgi:leucyl/phenylalanyl-tRNA--protein transferase
VPLLTFIEAGDPFPPTGQALREPNGLLACGGDLSPSTLLSAYRRGIFPWYDDPEPILWWSPDPRSVILPEQLHISRSLRRTLRRNLFRLSVNGDFTAVMRACAAPRQDQHGTWINPDMVEAYSTLNKLGWAHSIEVRDADGALLGGLYGVAMGRAFFGESMFSRVADASKVALVALAWSLRQRGGGIIDCQLENPHLNSLGARRLPRVDFEALLDQTVGDRVHNDAWRLPEHCGALL